MRIDVSVRNQLFFEALSSETRLRIVELLAAEPKNIHELSDCLGLSSAMMTKHIQLLEKAGIVASETLAGKRGMKKLCRLKLERTTLDFQPRSSREENSYSCSMPVGQYKSYEVLPTCGLASGDRMIGIIDDPRYFADPEHVQAMFVWFGGGYVEYSLPNYLLSNQTATGINIALEICSEAPGYNENWPSDISFSVNGVDIGVWTSPGDFGNRSGRLTPSWWQGGSQYGLLKTITVDETGSFIDGVKLSDISISRLGLKNNSEFTLRIGNSPDARNQGGVCIFGRAFGNYDQDIDVTIFYK